METKKFWKVIIFAVLTVCLLQSMVHADDVKTGPRPGKTSPFNPTHPLLFRDDELLLFAGYTDDYKAEYQYFTPQKDDLTAWSEQATEHQFLSSEFSSTSRFRHMAAASGRLINPDKRDTAVHAFFRPDGDVEVELWDPKDGRQSKYVTLHGTKVSDRSVDVAVGDLDLSVDDEGNYHDEIVVVRQVDMVGTSTPYYQIDVLDHDLNQIINGHSEGWQDGPSLVAVGIGDFNGDGYPEVAVGMASSTKLAHQVSIYQFVRDEDGNLKSPLQFEKVKDNYFKQSPGWTSTPYDTNVSFDITVGDFNGDGKDEIFMASTFPGTWSRDAHYLDTSILRSDQDMKLDVASSVFRRLPTDYASESASVPDGQLRAQSGLFKFDPNNGWGLNRSQIALCYIQNWHRGSGDEYSIQCLILTVNDDLSFHLPNPIKLELEREFTTKKARFYSIDISTGNFTGHGQDGKATSPLMDLAISYTEAGDYSSFIDKSEYKKKHGMKIIRDPLQNDDVTYSWEKGLDWNYGDDPKLQTSLTVMDGDGDTYRLGPPAHIVVENLISLDYIIQEPPKHVDYLPAKPTDPNSTWTVFNVSAKSDFNVQFIDSQKTTFSTTSKNTSNWSIGGSAEFDVKSTFDLGFGDIVKAELTTESDTKIGYQYDKSKSNWNSQYASRETSFTSKTENDDFLAGKIQLMDIWRYPILGYNTGDTNKPYGMYEIILPGPILLFAEGGFDHSDWYQPSQQNHNILSYPLVTATPFPADLGYFTPLNGTSTHKTMNEMVKRSFSGVSQQIDVSWSTEAGAGSEKSYNKTLSESEDIKIGMEAKVSTSDVNLEATLSFNNSNSWGGSTTEDSTNSESKGITINVPAGDKSKAYSFMSAVYVSSGGGQLKVAHTADPLGSDSGKQWWKNQYGGKPDPALNLPNRFQYNRPSGEESEEYWTLDTEDSRMEMRGFFMRKNTPNPVSGEYDLLGSSPTDGDTVQLCARVYNFSLYQPTGTGTDTFDVLFDYVLYDDEKGTEVVDSRVSVGTVSTTLKAITDSGYSPKEVCVPWNTTGLSNTSYTYRFYVTVDPNNKVKDEIHEWKDSQGDRLPHGNNEGYWPWGSGVSVLTNQSQSADVQSVQASKSSASMHIKSLEIEVNSRLKSKGTVRVFAHEKYRLRAHIVANEDHPHYHYTVFYDGHPEDGKVIAIKTNWAVVNGDNYVWTSWTPQETGKRKIYVHFIEDLDDENKGDSWDSLKVNVRKKPKSRRD